MSTPLISVIVPVYNEERGIAAFLDSVLASDYPADRMELILVDGMSSDRTREIIEAYRKKDSRIRLLDNPQRTAPHAMNCGIRASSGSVIIRLDAHSLYPKEYFSFLVKGLAETHADNIGVCWTGCLWKNTPKAAAIRDVLFHRFGGGQAAYRNGVSEAREVETVPFGCWPRETFEKFGLFDVRLTRNQDIELNARIRRNGGKIILLPGCRVEYFVRDTWKAIAKNNFANGRWNVLTIWYTKRTDIIGLRHLVPLIFILSLVVPFLLLPFAFLTRAALLLPSVSVLSLSAYTLAVAFFSFKLMRREKQPFHLYLISFFVLHFSYGAGSLIGLLNVAGLSIQKLIYRQDRKNESES